MKNEIIFLFLAVSLALLNGGNFVVVKADSSPSATLTPTTTPDPSSQTSSIQDCANNHVSVADCPQFLRDKINDLEGQAKTLSSQISIMDSQISLTKLRIESTKEQIAALTSEINTASKKIDGLNDYLNDLTKILINRIVATYEAASIQPIQILAASSTASDFLSRLSYLQIAQAHDKKLIYDTQAAKDDYANQKQIFEDKKQQVEALKAQLESYTQQLAQEQQSKKDLLVQTQGNEANYQRLLAQAKAQLASFSRFVAAQGGASILNNQTTCDDWGCYYNQRDSQWGNMLINGQAGYTMAGYGCLITSIAMVASHMGHREIMPSDIAQSSGDNFSVNTAMLRFTINVKGITITRNGTSLDSALASGPVIVGIYAYGGTHFVVIKSTSNGNYIMDDPFIPNGSNLSFTDHYSLDSIFEIDKVSM